MFCYFILSQSDNRDKRRFWGQASQLHNYFLKKKGFFKSFVVLILSATRGNLKFKNIFLYSLIFPSPLVGDGFYFPVLFLYSILISKSIHGDDIFTVRHLIFFQYIYLSTIGNGIGSGKII